jgi:hypothetical protein
MQCLLASLQATLLPLSVEVSYLTSTITEVK